MDCRIYIHQKKLQWHLILTLLAGASTFQNSDASECFGCYSDSSSDEKNYIIYNPTHINKNYQTTLEDSYSIHTLTPQKPTKIETVNAQNSEEKIHSIKTGEEVKFPSTAQQILK